MSAAHAFLDQPVPFLRYKEKDLVLLDRASERASEIVAANRILFGGRVEMIKNGVLGIQNVVAAEVISAAVQTIRPRLRDQGDYASASSAELGAIAVPLDFELLNGVKGRVNKDRAIGTYVDVVGAIHQKQDRIRRTAADGNVRSTVKAFLVVRKAIINLHAGNRQE